MEAINYRIGNYVSYNNENESIGKITALISDFVPGLDYCLIDYRANKKHWLININPIPITIDFLLENGFTKEINYRLIIDDFYHLELMKIGNEFSVFHEKRPDEEYAHHFRRIKYIHELQNFFFGITGKDFVVKTISSNAC